MRDQRIYHAVHMSCAVERPKVCPVCGKTFYATSEHAYKASVRSTAYKDLVCSYSCMRAVERRQEEKARLRQEALEKAREERQKVLMQRKREVALKAAQQRQNKTREQISEQIRICIMRHKELLVVRESAAYKRMTSKEKRLISRKMTYWAARCRELNKRLSEEIDGITLKPENGEFVEVQEDDD